MQHQAVLIIDACVERILIRILDITVKCSSIKESITFRAVNDIAVHESWVHINAHWLNHYGLLLPRATSITEVSDYCTVHRCYDTAELTTMKDGMPKNGQIESACLTKARYYRSISLCPVFRYLSKPGWFFAPSFIVTSPVGIKK